MNTRCIAIMLVIALSVGLFAACGTDKENTTPDSENTAENPTEAPTEAPTPEPVIEYTEHTYNFSEISGKYKVQGRTTVVNQKVTRLGFVDALALDYTAAAVEFNAYCEGTVTVELSSKPTTIGGTNLYYNVIVDGVKQGNSRKEFKTTGTKNYTITLAENLERGLHTFVIERQNEAERGSMLLLSVTMTGELTDAPKNKDRFIEIIGDSITTGYGNLWPSEAGGDKDSNPASNVFVDGTRTYGYLTAKALDADYSIVAQQGLGIAYGHYPHTMPETYKMICYQNNRKDEWNFERKADVVVLNLGTNDFNFMYSGQVTREKILTESIAFLKTIRECYPDAKIVWAFGMMINSDQCWSCINEAIKTVGGEEAGFYTVKLESNYDGGNTHPSAAAHERNAVILTNYLKELMGW